MRSDLRRHGARGLLLLLAATFAIGHCLVLCGAVAAERASDGLVVSPLECSPDLDSIRFDFCLSEYRVNRTLERSDGTLVSVPGLRNIMESGKPSLPVEGFYVGIPADVSSARVRVLSESYVIERDCNVLPWSEPGTETADLLDENVYERPGLFPESPVKVSRIGSIRSQKVALISIFPVQFDSREKLLRIVSSASVEIEFVRVASTLPVDARIGFRDESRFEPMLARLLANYEQAKFYRLISRRDSGKAIDHEYWYDPETTYLKVSTFEDGVYKVDYDFLQSHGVDPSVIDTDNLKLYYRGEMAPIVLFDGGDGSFDDGDFLVFVGGRKRSEQVGWALDEYTDEAVWWLCWDDGEGMRFQGVSQDIEGPVLVLDGDSFFWAKEHFEQDVLYDGWNDDVDQDSWFWETIWYAPDYAAVSFTLHAFDEAVVSAATVSVRMKGNSSVVKVNPDHHSVFYVNENDTPLADYFWDGYEFETMPFQVPTGNFVDGRNKITVVSPGDTEASFVDSVYINWVEVEYPRRYQAIRGEAWFVPPPGFDNRPVQYRLESFGQSDVLILDVATGRVFPEYSHSNEDGRWVLRFVDPEPSERSLYWAARESAFLTPPAAVLDEPSTLRDASNQADMIIITVREFFAPLEQLVEFRNAQGINVKVVDVQDIFDEFSYGMFNPLAMRSFLWFAYHNWAEPVATHVLLVGDASWDYRFLDPESVIPNYVPSYLNPARDDKFVNVTGEENDWYPDFAIGRMPVQDAQALTKMIVNVIRYETSPPPGDWTRRAILVTGGKNWLEQETFVEQARDFEAQMPDNFEFAEVFKETEGWDDKDYYAQRILDELTRGALLTVFLGHGARNQWDFMLESSDLWGLNCEGRTSLVLSMTCHTGRYANPKTPCIGERFIIEGDALSRSVAYWGSTGVTSLWNPYFLTMYLLEEIFEGGSTDMGLAIMAAKLKFYEESQDVTLASSQTWLSDPMLRINVPPVPAPSDVAAAVEGDTVTISWAYTGEVEELAGFEVCVLERQEPHSAPLSPCDDGYTFRVPPEEREMTLLGGGASLEYCAVVRSVLNEGSKSHVSEKACFRFGVSGSRGPSIIGAGYADTRITHERGGRLNLYAMLQDPDGLDDVQRVEIYYNGVATDLVLEEVLPGIFHTGIDLGPGLAPGQYLLELRASDRMGNTSSYFPYFAVRGWGLPWPDYSAASTSSSWEFDASRSDGPVIVAAGFLSGGITSFSGGETTLLALVGPGASDARVLRVDIFLDGVFIGAQLCDDGLHGDFAAGDGIFGLKAPIIPGYVPGNYLFGLRAVDENGHAGAMWPFLNVW